MRTMTIFAVGLTAALMLVVVMSLPASAQPTYGSGFTLLSSISGLSGANSPTIILVKGGGGHHGSGFRGGLGFYGGFSGPYGYGYGPNYGADGYGYYEEGNNTCVWNGYNYRCYNTNQGVY
jgi:hypothetical protein